MTTLDTFLRLAEDFGWQLLARAPVYPGGKRETLTITRRDRVVWLEVVKPTVRRPKEPDWFTTVRGLNRAMGTRHEMYALWPSELGRWESIVGGQPEAAR